MKDCPDCKGTGYVVVPYSRRQKNNCMNRDCPDMLDDFYHSHLVCKCEALAPPASEGEKK